MLGEPVTPEAVDADARARTPYPELLGALTFLMPLSELRCFAAESRRWACEPLMSEREVEVDSGLGGRLETLELPLGGSGNAPILLVLRTDLPGGGSPEDVVDDGGEVPLPLPEVGCVVLSVGTAGVERALVGFGVGSPEVVTDLCFAGVGSPAPEEPGLDSSGISGSAFLVFEMGSAGNGPDGGASGDVEGRRTPVEVMVAVTDADITYCSDPDSTANHTRLFVRVFVVVMETCSACSSFLLCRYCFREIFRRDVSSSRFCSKCLDDCLVP